MSYIHTLPAALKSITSAIRAQNTRMLYVSQNLAHSKTPGYQRHLVTFGNKSINGVDHVVIKKISKDPKKGEKIYDPSHPSADPDGFIEMSNVNPMVELADTRQAGIQHTACTTVMQRILDMINQSLALIRT